MKQNMQWIVECRGEMEAPTRIFESETDARRYFQTIQLTLDQTKYLFVNDQIIEKDNDRNAVYLIGLHEKKQQPLSPLFSEARFG